MVIVNRARFALAPLSLLALVPFSSGCDSGSHTSDSSEAGVSGSTQSTGGSALGGASSSASGAPNGGATPGGGGSAGTPNGGQPMLVPATGALFGSFVGTGPVSDLEAILGRKISVNHNYFAWTDDFSGQMATDVSAGRVPFITWEAWKDSVGTSLDQIIAGGFDPLIHQNAAAVKALAKPFFLRWGHEMNGNWYPWSGALNGADMGGPAKYIAAYRHIHDVFVADGATNAQWVFCPNVDSVPSDAWNAWPNYYPGDDYVDWTCADGYNWGTTMSYSSWESFQAIFSRIYPALAAKNKPILIGETSSTEMGGDKAQWISAVLPALKASFPAVKALVWFDINKETDWRVDSSPAAQTAFVAMVKDPYFNP